MDRDEMYRDEMLERLFRESDIRTQKYIELHKDDPCESCGSREEVVIIPTGGLGRLTAVCAKCHESWAKYTEAYNRGFAAGVEESKRKFKSLARWRRMLCRIG